MVSDYTPLLEDLHPDVGIDDRSAMPRRSAVASFGGHRVQPSHYEPFALTVGEALASGSPVVASDEVGATEGVDPQCCRVFAAGDLDVSRAVRELGEAMSGTQRGAIRRLAPRRRSAVFTRSRVSSARGRVRGRTAPGVRRRGSSSRQAFSAAGES